MENFCEHTWLRVQLAAAGIGVASSVQGVHQSDARGLLQDLTDPSQARFGELMASSKYAHAVDGTELVALAGASAESAFGRSLMTVVPSERGAHAELLVLRVVRDLIDASSAPVSAETPLMEAGVDSLAATELSSRLRALMGVALSPTLIFEHPTARAIGAHVATVKKNYNWDLGPQGQAGGPRSNLDHCMARP